MRLKDTAISVEVRENGDWVDKIPDFPGLRLRVRGAGNKDWRKLRDKLIADIPRHKRIDGITAEDGDKVTATLLVETSLLDWDGLEDDDGKPLPFSKAQASEYLNNPEYEGFRNACLWAAGVVAERWRQDVETAAKN